MSLVRFLKTGAALVDHHSLTELTATVQTLTPDATLVAPRDLTPQELTDLDRLRAPLAGDVDRTDSRAVSWFWDHVAPAAAGTPAPAGLVEWVGVALGDLLVSHVAGARWMVCPGPTGPTLGVVGTAWPLAPVVPLPDAQDRWAEGSRGWIPGYLGAAAAHLAGVSVPQPRTSVENDPASAAAAGSVAAEGPEPVDIPATVDADAQLTAGEAEADWAPVVAPALGGALPSRHHDTSEPAAATVPDEPLAAAAEQSAAAVEPVTAVAEQSETVAEQSAPVAEPVATPSEPVAAPAAAATPTRPTNLPHPPSAAAQDLALRALEHALVVLRRGPFDREAFVMLVDDSGVRTLACTGDPAQALRDARETARTSGARTAAIGWIDRNPAGIPDPRQGFPAVLVEASEAGAPGLRVAHRFVEDALGTGPLGEPVLVGEVAPLL